MSTTSGAHNPARPGLLLAALGLFAFMQLALLCWMNAEYYLPGPVQDSWGIMPYLQEKLAHGNWFDAALWLPQNGHRLVFLRLEYLVDYHWFHGSNHFLVVITALLLAGEILCFQFLLQSADLDRKAQYQHLLLVSCLVLFPTMAWSFQHIFNIHMVHYALLAVATCVLIAQATENHSKVTFAAGLALAILCNFASFSATTIWPAVLLILVIQRSSLVHLAVTLLLAVTTTFVYLDVLPLGMDASSNFESLNSLASNLLSGKLLTTLPWLAGFIITYLSLPPAEHGLMQAITLLSLAWFGYALVRTRRYKPARVESAALGIMAFGICLAITTGIARGALGELSYGLRFQPMVLMYWAGFCLGLLHHVWRHYRQVHTTLLCILAMALFFSSLFSTADIGKRLSEDHTRFARMQMAYLSGNLGENAMYENMVAEWRNESYAGIVASIPFLAQNHLGVFNTDFGNYVSGHMTIETTDLPACLEISLTAKPRNNDPLVRNLVIEANTQHASQDYPYLLLYQDNKLEGLAFRKRNIVFHNLMSTGTIDSTWFGVSKNPLRDNVSLVAFRSKREQCRVTIRPIQ